MMNMTMMRWVWHQALALGGRLVLLTLADECGDDGLDEALGALEAAGLVGAHRRSGRLSVGLRADDGEAGSAGLGAS